MNILKADGFLSRRKKRRQLSRNLYMSIVAQARQPVFYMDYGVPDTVDGRFDMICLHAGLLMDRLGKEGAEGRNLAQALFDTMFLDMERSLRERGVGDLGVPKHVKRMMKGFNGRARSYRKALCAARDSEDPLEAALARNLYAGDIPVRGGTALMARYVRRCVRALAEADSVYLMGTGFVTFPAADDLQEKKDERDSVSRMVA